MPDISVAPHAQPGDDFQIVPRHSDFPPDEHEKPSAKGKVAKDVTVPTKGLDHGDYWILVGDSSIGLSVGTDQERRDGRARQKDQKQRERDQKDAEKLAQRTRDEKERLMEKDEPVDPSEQPSENRPPNPEDQPNELPIEDNTGTTRSPTGGDAAKTGPVRRRKKA